MTGPEVLGRRTSPWVLVLHTVTFRQARALVPAVLALGVTRGLGDGPGTIIALVAGITLLSLLGAAITWWRFSYIDGDAAVVVTRGLLTRSARTVPNDRIRGVEVEAPALHRVLGLVRVRIDAAAGSVTSEEELVIDGVTRAEGDRLRNRLLTHAASAQDLIAGRHAAAEPEEELLRFDYRWLVYAPLVGSYLAVPLAAGGALLRAAEELPEQFLPEFWSEFWSPDVSDTRIVVRLVVSALLLLILGSIIGSALVNWRFRLLRRGGALVAVRGLVTRRHTELDIDRIRGCTISEGLGMRLVGAARVSALVTGLGDATRRGQVLPLGPVELARALSTELVDHPGPLRRHPPAARRRSIARGTTPGLLVAAAGGAVLALTGWWPLLAAGAALVLLGVPLGLARYNALGHVAGPRSFALRSGWLVRSHTVLQDRAVVGWEVRQSVVQRRAGLATVLACVGAGSGGYTARDMAADEVAEFTRAASGGWAATLTPYD
ncbi:PH domain-containing protein [Modestobacter sp. VKM Ac-2978]|uniref:PH domain-containing protein n=1 Tax=Modestobacter sp. VKM Ac-2978 TaxID=3004132 RepID=UPI0022A9FB71|nr:PH domain-containing protein [Modestobacter sp. VKM Ac-2978]MCZ2846411.1 PH domain-containing protein [Modestobacter sp. VKM Ac-2978]